MNCLTAYRCASVCACVRSWGLIHGFHFLPFPLRLLYLSMYLEDRCNVSWCKVYNQKEIEQSTKDNQAVLVQMINLFFTSSQPICSLRPVNHESYARETCTKFNELSACVCGDVLKVSIRCFQVFVSRFVFLFLQRLLFLWANVLNVILVDVLESEV